MASAGGPIKAMPACVQASANSAFSDRNPYPGWILHPRLLCHFYDAISTEVAISSSRPPNQVRFVSDSDVPRIAVRFGVNGHGSNPESRARREYAAGDLPAISHQDFLKLIKTHCGLTFGRHRNRCLQWVR